MFDLNLTIPILALLVSVASLHYQRKQTLMATAQMPGQEVRKKRKWWFAPSTLALCALVLLAWAPWIMAELSGPNPRVVGWGGVPNVRPLSLQIIVDGSSLHYYAGSHRLIAVALHYSNDVDIDDVGDLQKSASFSIKDEIVPIVIRTNVNYITDLLRGMTQTNYHPCLSG